MTSIEKVLQTAAKIVDNNAVYIWSAQGEKVYKLSPEQIRQMESSETNAKAVLNRIQMLESVGLLNKKNRAFDCSGLICWLMVKAGIEKIGFDMKADDLFKHYPKTPNLKAGCLLHRSGHIALYIGHGYLIEAKGRKYGCCISVFDASEWDKVFAWPYSD